MIRDLILFVLVLITVTTIAALGSGCVPVEGEEAEMVQDLAAPNPVNCIIVHEGSPVEGSPQHRWGFCNDSLRTFVCNDVTCLPLKVGH